MLNSRKLACYLEARLWFNFKALTSALSQDQSLQELPTPRLMTVKLQCNLDGIEVVLIRKEMNGSKAVAGVGQRSGRSQKTNYLE